MVVELIFMSDLTSSLAARNGDLLHKLSQCSDMDIEWIFRNIDRLDFDRIRRKIGYLTHRRDGV